jgi:hypothetical protein
MTDLLSKPEKGPSLFFTNREMRPAATPAIDREDKGIRRCLECKYIPAI